MKHEVNKSKVISSIGWKMSEGISTQFISFLMQLVLARLLSPSDYGTVGLVTIYISISTVIIQSGFADALVRKKNIDDEDLSSVFYIYLVMAVILYAVLFFFAPFISRFYAQPILVPILRVLGLNLFPRCIHSIQGALISRSLKFKLYYMRTVIALIISGIVGLIMAYFGFGVWALVGLQSSNIFAAAFILWFTVKWRPKWVFSFSKAKELFSYGYKVLISNLITTLYTSLNGLIIGKIYEPSVLGFYTKGQQFSKMVMTAVDSTITSVLLPTLSSMQDDKAKLKKTMGQAISSSSFMLCPLMLGLAVVSRPLILILLGEKWLPSVPFSQITCFAYIFWPMQTTNVAGLQALGRSDIVLRLGIVKRVIGVALLLLSVKFGVYAMMIANVVTQIIGCFIHARPNKSLLGYGIKEQVMDIVPALSIATIMAAAIFPLRYVIQSNMMLLATQIISGVLIYLLLSKIFKVEALNFMWVEAKSFVKNRKKVS